jgi:hypothetical protein
MRTRWASRTCGVLALLAGAGSIPAVALTQPVRTAAMTCQDMRVDRAAWRPARHGGPRPGRLESAQALVGCRKLIGARRPEVTALLGAPDRREGRDAVYELGSEGSRGSRRAYDLLLRFDGAGRVTGTTLRVDEP